MGAWGTGIFDNDLALDVRAVFEDGLSEGLSVEGATEKILRVYGADLRRPSEESNFWLALAGLQLERGAVQPEIREKVASIIHRGTGLGTWEESGLDSLVERKQVLEQLRERLRIDNLTDETTDTASVGARVGSRAFGAEQEIRAIALCGACGGWHARSWQDLVRASEAAREAQQSVCECDPCGCGPFLDATVADMERLSDAEQDWYMEKLNDKSLTYDEKLLIVTDLEAKVKQRVSGTQDRE